MRSSLTYWYISFVMWNITIVCSTTPFDGQSTIGSGFRVMIGITILFGSAYPSDCQLFRPIIRVGFKRISPPAPYNGQNFVWKILRAYSVTFLRLFRVPARYSLSIRGRARDCPARRGACSNKLLNTNKKRSHGWIRNVTVQHTSVSVMFD